LAFETLPPLNWLRAFESAARHLSFTDAAHELNLSQAAISKQVKLLEQHLRQQLFVRLPRSLALTKSGDAYLPKVRDAFERLNLGTQEVFGRQRSAVVTVRCAISFAVNWLAPRLPDFMAMHPKAKIRLVSSVWDDNQDTDQFDFDIQYGTGNWPNADCHRLTYETLLPLCAPSLKNILGTPADLKNHNLLHVIGYQDGWATWLNAAGISDIDPGGGFHCDTSLVAFELAANGGGVALGRSSLVEKELQSGRLVAPFKLAVPVDEAFYLIRPAYNAASDDANLFADWMIVQSGLISPHAERVKFQSVSQRDVLNTQPDSGTYAKIG
jgi:LysR family transcriptional regulator, glycine cleavage system transcriptional activator